MDKIVIPAIEIPSYRTGKALERGNAHKMLFTTWGGIGDQICAEPTLRFAIDTFKQCEVYLASENPELYRHLSFKKVFDTRKVKPIKENYLVFETIPDPARLTFEFVSHCVTHCVDFPTLASLRCTTPISYKSVILTPKISPERKLELSEFIDNKYVAIHAGRHWPSKTFPASWWNGVLEQLKLEGYIPVLFGKDEETQGTVDTITEGCVDLREKTTLEESIWLLQRMKSMVTNDSSPMHMAATGDAYIAFIASAKHHDFLYHWRHGKWAWRMQHFNKGGIWDTLSHCPNQQEPVLVDQVNLETLKSWLPEPKEITSWITRKLSNDLNSTQTLPVSAFVGTPSIK